MKEYFRRGDIVAFPQSVADRALVACGRRCCICHDFCGTKMELHHIHQHADGGEDTFENCIPLCFNCHAEMGKVDPHHPKGKGYSQNELRMHRDNWYNTVVKLAISTQNTTDHSVEYDALRKRIAKALSLYADRIYNPVDLSRTTDRKLPPYYDEASNALRELAAELKSVAETMDDGYPITQAQMKDAAGYFFGLSNGLACNQDSSQHTVKDNSSFEKHIREIFSLPAR